MSNVFKPYVNDGTLMAEFTPRAIIMGCIFGVLFGAANVYLALRAGLTVSASIPIAVMAISLGRKALRTTILENNIIQTTGSAGESIASGVVFTLPAFLFLSADAGGEVYFNYWTIFALAVIGGLLGTLMMIPLRRSLIVQEHATLPYPEGTACAQVLIAGDKGGKFARTAYLGLAAAGVYALLQKFFHFITDVPGYLVNQTNKFMPSARVDAEITPEYLGVGYIIGPRISGQLVAGGVLAWLALIPLLAFLVPADVIAAQLVKIGYLASLTTEGGPGGWNPLTHSFTDTAEAVYKAFVRQIGAGAVAAGGFITLFKTLPTIVRSFRQSVAAIRGGSAATETRRTENDLSIKVTLYGCLVLVALIAVLPVIPGDTLLGKLLIGVLVIVFGFFFVTVSSRIVGIIGSSNSPVSGMTIATIMGTALVFIAFGLTGKAYEPMVLVVGGLICIAAANAGNTSQDLKTGFLIGATPRAQQLALFIGAIVSTFVVGYVVHLLDTPTAAQQAEGIKHAIGNTYAAPQATLMATLIKGLLGNGLDWQYVMVGVFLAVTVELCGVNALSFAVGAYLPLSTTLPIFAGGCVKGLVDWNAKRKNQEPEEGELGRGSLFATGLVAGGALMGVLAAALSVWPASAEAIGKLDVSESLKNALGSGGYMLLGTLCFVALGVLLYRVAVKKDKTASTEA
ncbi:MAG: oligopeptide transporter, OPT family [Bacteroidia bacterium]|jgi:OPT family oligopeptide transporter|nr:oligopeptide transporter, OPT family [Bacteroidia bacterium]